MNNILNISNFIASGDIKSAKLCLDTVHAYDPTNAMYFVCQLMIEHNCKQFERIPEINKSIINSEWYESAVNYADEKLKAVLKSYGTYTVYNELQSVSKEKTEVGDFEKALNILGEIDYGALLETDSDLAGKIKDLKAELEKQIADKKESDRIKAR